MDPQQELFTAILTALRAEYPDSVYDGLLPPDTTPYPFIYIADSTLTDTPNKTAVFGNVSQTIHVWHDDPHQRGTVSAMMLKVKDILRGLEKTNNFKWVCNDLSQQILADTTTNAPLLHGIIEAGYRFS